MIRFSGEVAEPNVPTVRGKNCPFHRLVATQALCILWCRYTDRMKRVGAASHETRLPPYARSFCWPGPMSDAPSILNAIDHNDPRAASQILPLVYDELRKLAASKMAHEPAGQTLDATALVHEAYLRLVGDDPGKVLGRPRSLLCGGSRGDAANLGGKRLAQRIGSGEEEGSIKHGSTWTKSPLPSTHFGTSCSRSMARLTGSPRPTRQPPSSSNFGISPALRSPRPPTSWASRHAPLTVFGAMPVPGCAGR